MLLLVCRMSSNSSNKSLQKLVAHLHLYKSLRDFVNVLICIFIGFIYCIQHLTLSFSLPVLSQTTQTTVITVSLDFQVVFNLKFPNLYALHYFYYYCCYCYMHVYYGCCCVIVSQVDIITFTA